MSMSDGTDAARTRTTNGAAPTGSARQEGGDQAVGMVDTAREAQGAMKETAQEAMETAKSTVTEMAGQTQEQAGEMISQVSDQVAATVGDVKEQAVTSFTEQRDRAVTTLSALADALREAGRTLDQQRQAGSDGAQMAAVAPFVDEAANRLSQSADFLRDKQMSGLFEEAQQLARKQPMLFMASMFGVGLVGARLLKGTKSDGAGNGEAQSAGNSSSSFGATGSSGQMPGGYGGAQPLPGQGGASGQTGGMGATQSASSRSGSSDSAPASGSGTPGAGWQVDDLSRPGETATGDTRLFNTPGGEHGSDRAGGSVASQYRGADPNSLADAERSDALTDAGRAREGRGEGQS